MEFIDQTHKYWVSLPLKSIASKAQQNLKYDSVANSISKRLLIVFGNYYFIYYDALSINAYFWIQTSNNFKSQFYFQCLTGIIFKKAIVISWHSIQFPEQLGLFVILTCKLICGITFKTCKLVCGVTSRRTGI